MARFFLKIEYDGTPFCGWQRQANGPSVQEALETAGRAFCGAETPVVAAGRTDAGVHALAMIAHIDLPRDASAFTLANALNAYLRPHPISVLDAAPVADDLHARFSCCGRRYLYRVLVRRAPSALSQRRAWRVTPPIDVSAMQQAAPTLLGKHDFTTFRATHCQADSPVKTLDCLDIEPREDEIWFHLAAPSFLHNQVRSIVGTLMQVGLGRWAPADVRRALEAVDRRQCGPVAPAEGLYFAEAMYRLPVFNAARTP